MEYSGYVFTDRGQHVRGRQVWDENGESAERKVQRYYEETRRV
jgi:hypothetical protein